MGKFKNFLRFLGVWFLSAVILVFVAAVVLPAGEDGTVVLGEWYTFFVIIVPIALGVFFVKYLPAIRKRNKRKDDLEDHDVFKTHMPYTSGEKTAFCANTSHDFEEQYLFNAAVNIVLETKQASASMLQRRLGLSYSRSAILLDQMESMGIIGPFEGSAPRQILVTKNYWAKHSPQCVAPPTKISHNKFFEVVDTMEGHEFEYWCADVLRGNGFSNVEVTQGSGDQGVDIIAEKDRIRYAVQCKCYSSDLGNKPVQEVNAGKTIYHCHIGVVMTNRYFTVGAKQAADATGTLLWDRDDLIKMAQNAEIVTSTP